MKNMGHLAGRLAIATLLASCLAVRAADSSTDPGIEFFESRIRPVLVEHCYECHNSTDTAKAKLAIDHRAGLRTGGSRGPAIVPGDPDKSLLLQVVRHEINDVNMPKDGAKLEPRVIADLARWIEMGAPDPRDQPPTRQQLEQATSWETTLERRKQWWCFQPLTNPDVPPTNETSWSNHPVDRFILSQLNQAKLAPADRADQRTLIRRLSFALIGLPPAPEDMQRYLSDPASNAYETWVDRFLSSERFGERWARHWMDWIRYADSHGSEGDPAIPHAYRYRDYLIRALNADVPYDQLVREHVAGDLLGEPRINETLGINESALATAHWRMVFHGFSPTDALDEKVRFTDDQINAFSKAFLGLTVSCARCHNHKFDAISQNDYYALFGILGSTRPAIIDLNTPDRQQRHQQRLGELKQQIRQAVADVWIDAAGLVANQLLQLPENPEQSKDGANHPSKVLNTWQLLRQAVKQPEQFAEVWRKQVAEWKNEQQELRKHDERAVARRWTLSKQEDYNQWFGQGNGLSDRPSTAGEFAITPAGDRVILGIYPAGVYSHRLSTRHRAVLGSPRFRLDREYDLWMQIAGDGGALARYTVQNYPRSGTVYPVTKLKGGQWTWQKHDLAYWKGEDVHIELCTAADAPVLATGNMRSWFGIRQAMLIEHGSPPPPAEPREFLEPLLLAANPLPTSLQDVAQIYAHALVESIRAWQRTTMTDGQALLLDDVLKTDWLPNRVDQLPDIKPLIDEYRRLEAEVPMPTRVAALTEADSFDQPLMIRGNHKKLGDPVPRRFLEAIDATPYRTSQSGRLELAADLVRPDNPLTARVMVNRIWHHLFGRGIVSTPDNFGRLGDQPTHPELLDYLATRLVTNGWSIKDTIRFLVTSQTWQLSSVRSAKAQQIDPDNRLLSHAHVRRLEAEAIRDALLSVSAQLDLDMYGPAVGGDSRRRSVYIRMQRNALDPFLRVFDLPEPFSAKGRRDATNVPAQSLTMMNDPQVESYGSQWADQVLNDESLENDEQRIQRMFLTALGRPATSEEVNSVRTYLADTQREHQQLATRLAELNDQVAHHHDAIRNLTEPIRDRLIAQIKTNGKQRPALQPIARWEFDEDLRDSLGSAHGEAHGGARIEDGALVVDGRQAYVITAPLTQSLKEKTLEAWVKLDNLTQRAGGVMTVQTPDGQLFDSIVFAEKDPQQWLAGSNFFTRTQSFQAPHEKEANERPVHVAIVYHPDGRIVGYRDGRAYGRAYHSNGPQEFQAGNTTVTFGVRHLPATGNRMLAGRIMRAQLYDRALTADQIIVTSNADPHFVSESEILTAMTDAQRQHNKQLKDETAKLESDIHSLGDVPKTPDHRASWKNLARAIFSFKEFIYVR